MSAWEVISAALIGLGSVTMLVGALGVLRFPGFYTRLHAAGKGDTLGQGLILLGLVFVAGFSLDAFKLVLIVFFVFILNSTATHALARAGWLAGLRPWKSGDPIPADQREGQLEGDATEEGAST